MSLAEVSEPKAAITELFERCRLENRAALILFLTSGYPNSEVTEKVLRRVADAGADLIELGVPFSDPIADGPVIQKASTEALLKGMSLAETIRIAKDFRTYSSVPVILFGALNPFLQMGYEQLAQSAAEAGVNGVLAADMPIEEADEFSGALSAKGLGLIPLVAPTTPAARLELFAKHRFPFVYCISYKGTTGTRGIDEAELRRYLNVVRSKLRDPLAVGFGIKTPENARSAVAAGADGVVVGSALVSLIGDAVAAGKDPVEEAGRYVESLVAALKK